MKLSLPLAVCALALSCAASGADDLATTSINYSDLNLSTKAGQQELAARVQKAADTICGGTQYSDRLADRQVRRDCRARVVSQASLRLASAIPTAFQSPAELALSDQK